MTRLLTGVLVVLAATTLAAQDLPVAAGTPVRIHTIPYTLDLPGVRVEPGQVVGSVISQDDDTITVRVTDGDPQILPRANRRISGTVLANQDGVLTLRRVDGSTVLIPHVALKKAERRVGRGSRGRNALWGLLIGAGSGAAILAIPRPCPSPHNCIVGRDAAAFVGALLGGGVGAAIGALVPGKERWRDIPLP